MATKKKPSVKRPVTGTKPGAGADPASEVSTASDTAVPPSPGFGDPDPDPTGEPEFGKYGDAVDLLSNDEIKQAAANLAKLDAEDQRRLFDESMQDQLRLRRCIEHYQAVMLRLDYAHSVIFAPLTQKTPKEKFNESLALQREAQAATRKKRKEDVEALRESGLDLRSLARIGRGATIDQVMKASGHRNPAHRRKPVPAKDPAVAARIEKAQSESE